MEPIRERRRPVIAVFIGLPGLGKSTQAETIATALGVRRLRIGDALAAKGLVRSPAEASEPELWYQRLLAHTAEYLEGAVWDSLAANGWAILDGFPRSLQETDALLRFVQAKNVALQVLHFGGEDVERMAALSLERQRSRAVRDGEPPNEAYCQGKLALAKGYDQPCLERLCRSGAALLTQVDPEWPLADAERCVRRSLRLDFERIFFREPTILETLCQLVPNGFLTGEAFARPFLNGRFGPLQAPWTAEVTLEGSASERREAQERLRRLAPSWPWHVTSGEEGTADGLEGGPRLPIESGKVRQKENGDLETFCLPGAEASLRRGHLRLEANADERTQGRIRQWLRAYPGLSSNVPGYAPRPVLTDWQTIHAAVCALERGGRRHWNGLSSQEALTARALQNAHRQAVPTATAAPLPVGDILPDGNPWQADDERFGAWLMRECANGKPKDPRLAVALHAVREAPQKPTHQGWMTDQHAVMALLQLRTDHLPTHRRVLRLAMLYHDHGKQKNLHTPGAHAAIGAQLWQNQYGRTWQAELSPEEQRLIPFLIRHHDLLGRLARGTKEPGFQGGLDPAACRRLLRTSGLPFAETLALVEAINRADIASVAALRWTLYELDYALDMIRSTP